MLAELVTEAFIPNDTSIHADAGRVQVMELSSVEQWCLPSDRLRVCGADYI